MQSGDCGNRPQPPDTSMYRKDAFRSNMTNWIPLLSEAQAKFVHRNKAIHSLSPGVPHSPKAAQKLVRQHFTLHTWLSLHVHVRCEGYRAWKHAFITFCVSLFPMCPLTVVSLINESVLQDPIRIKISGNKSSWEKHHIGGFLSKRHPLVLLQGLKRS